MANKVIITADRTCDLGKDLTKRYDIHDIPLHIVFGDESYDDWETITPEEVYERFYETKELPKTAANNTEEYAEFFKKFIDEGYDIVHIALGSKLSSTQSASILAAQQFEGRVFCVDSCSLSTGSGLLAIKAAQMRDSGMSAKEIAEQTQKLASKAHASFVLERLDFMKAGGRCSAIALLGANLLSLRPSIEVLNNDGGAMTVGKKYRGKYGKVLIEYMEDTLAKYDNIDTDRVFITHAGADKEYVDLVFDALNAKGIFKEVLVTRASCVISSHCGPNTLGVLFMTK